MEQEDNTNAQDIETISTNSKDKQHVTFVRTSGAVPIATVGHTAVAEWTFPPKAPVPHIYHINQDMLMANDKITFKGFRKQFSGRFKRLVARKPESTSDTSRTQTTIENNLCLLNIVFTYIGKKYL
ncbi:LOW QUALITY PROTEIN: uncharacterized protein LOC108601911 [Drosophila busckii]|uniref:LOW QUALITY PROTEIN: uncharacterized protein LOC108601911 n=1 Tax=Drosophila busckii TaxID=30019 RepID=UPI00083F29AB|nr:LOW QUALITY PROTEIN: uncharacterized protein LOC108601911 [Drosophila busckii]